MTHAPLSFKLNDVDTSMPLLMEGKHTFVIEKAEVVPSSSGKGLFLAVTFKTVDDAMDKKGKQIKSGWPIINRYMLPMPGTEFGDGEHKDSYLAGLTKLQLAVLNLTDNAENKAALPEFDDQFIADLPGKLVIGNVKDSKDGEFGIRSEIKSVSPIG